MPALRHRKNDIEALALFFLKQYTRQYNMNRYFTPHVIDILKSYEWPGNIRELENLIQHLVIMSSNEEILTKDLPAKIYSINSDIQYDESQKDFDLLIVQYERKLLQDALKSHTSSYKIAKHLNISQTKASRLLRKHNLNDKK